MAETAMQYIEKISDMQKYWDFFIFLTKNMDSWN